MSKTIKIGDFIERLNNLDFKTSTKIKFQDKIYLYDYPNLTGIYEIGKPTKKEYSLFAQLDITNLHCEITIIEEQEEIEIQDIKQFQEDIIEQATDDNNIKCLAIKCNELVQAVKQLDKNIKEKQ